MTTLTLAPDLKLPLSTATETTLIVGKRGGGKSNTAVAMAEEFYRAHIPFAVLDPVDTWYGLKAGKDGKPAGGLGVYVFGGDHADVPLEPTAGAMMADVLVEHRISAVFVIRQFSNRQKAQFVADFADQLFKRNRDVLHLFCEEAHEVMPQQPYKGEEEMLGRMLKLQKLGRSSGIGLTSITQRPASLNKNATTQAEILIAHRLLGPQDIAAVEAWIKHHHVEDQKAEVLAGLPHLKTGEAWIWAPDFPEDSPIGLRQVKFRQAQTFDSRRTPKPGERRTEVKAMAPVDLEKLRTKMAATIEKAKAEDPKELRRKIADLERELNIAQRVTATKSPSVKEKRVEVPVIKDGQLKRLESVTAQAGKLIAKLIHSLNEIHGQVAKVANNISGQVPKAEKRIIHPPIPHPLHQHTDLPSGVQFSRQILRDKVQTRANQPAEAAGALPSGEKAILTAIGQYPAGATREQLTILTGYKRSSRDTYIQRMRNRGYVEVAGDLLHVTDDGRMALGPDFQPLPTGEALRQYWLNRLPEGERKLFQVLVESYPVSIERETLDEMTGYKRSSRDTYLQRLKARQLVELVGRGAVKASGELFA